MNGKIFPEHSLDSHGACEHHSPSIVTGQVCERLPRELLVSELGTAPLSIGLASS